MNAAFGITLNRYESPRHVSKRPRRDGRHEKKHAEATTQVHRGFDGSVHIPAELAAIVTAVFGLDNRIVGGTNGTGDPSGSTSLDVPTLAQMYNFPNTGAANQTIALLALLSELTRLASSHEDVYIRASDGLVTRPVAGYVYSANWETCTGGICTR
jgi:hypothetical protein